MSSTVSLAQTRNCLDRAGKVAQMNRHATLTIDPVCLKRLELSESAHQLAYKNVSYQFCSTHCLERFAEIPEYFIAPRRLEDNRPVPKQHRLRFSPVSSAILEGAIEKLRSLQGVTKVTSSERYVDLEYDLRLVSLRQMEAVLGDAGLPPRGTIHRLVRSFWRFSEHNELANMASQPSPCCSRPPVRVR